METTQISTEVDQAISELIEILSSLNPEELNNKKAPDVWSAAQIGEHLLKSYGVVEVLNGNTKKPDRPYDENVEQVKSMFLNFDIKFDSPEFIIPSSSFIDRDYLIKGLTARKAEIVEAADTLDLSLLCKDFGFPTIGEFTRFEWLSFITFHTQRHLRQLKNLLPA